MLPVAWRLYPWNWLPSSWWWAKERRPGEGREQWATSTSAARTVMMGINWDFIWWKEVMLIGAKSVSNPILFFSLLLLKVSQWALSWAGSEILTLLITFYCGQLGCAGEILLVNNLSLQKMFDFPQVKYLCGFRWFDFRKTEKLYTYLLFLPNWVIRE